MLIASRSDLLIGDMVSVLSLSLPYADPSQGFRVCYGQLGGSAFMLGERGRANWVRHKAARSPNRGWMDAKNSFSVCGVPFH